MAQVSCDRNRSGKQCGAGWGNSRTSLVRPNFQERTGRREKFISFPYHLANLKTDNNARLMSSLLKVTMTTHTLIYSKKSGEKIPHRYPFIPFPLWTTTGGLSMRGRWLVVRLSLDIENRQRRDVTDRRADFPKILLLLYNLCRPAIR